VGERAEDDEERRPDQERRSDHQLRGRGIDLELRGQEEERVELAGVPDDALAGGEAEQREEDDLAVLPLAERLGERRLRRLALFLHALERRRLVEAEADPDRDDQEEERHPERNAPA